MMSGGARRFGLQAKGRAPLIAAMNRQREWRRRVRTFIYQRLVATLALYSRKGQTEPDLKYSRLTAASRCELVTTPPLVMASNDAWRMALRIWPPVNSHLRATSARTES